MMKKIKVTKYEVFWFIGAILSSLLYFSGIFKIYIFIRKRILKRFRTIVVTYHKIGNSGENSDMTVSIRNFRKELMYLKEHFDVISLNVLIENFGKKPNKLRDNVAITFDDGYADNYLNAYPVLKQYKLTATIFLISNLIGKRDMLNVDEIKIMKKNGIDFGSHTANHKILSEIQSNEAIEEIYSSKVELENILNERIRFFAYPKGKKNHFNRHVENFVKKLGYTAAFTLENGTIGQDSNLFELNRIGIRNYPLFVFKVRVSGIFESRPVYFLRKLLKLT